MIDEGGDLHLSQRLEARDSTFLFAVQHRARDPRGDCRIARGRLVCPSPTVLQWCAAMGQSELRQAPKTALRVEMVDWYHGPLLAPKEIEVVDVAGVASHGTFQWLRHSQNDA